MIRNAARRAVGRRVEHGNGDAERFGGLLAASIVGAKRPEIMDAVRAHRAKQTADVLAGPDPREA